MEKIRYHLKIEACGEQAYDEIGSFLGGISFGHEYNRGRTYYFLDLNKEGVAKLNATKKTIELSDKVEGWIIESINHINEQERVR